MRSVGGDGQYIGEPIGHEGEVDEEAIGTMNVCEGAAEDIVGLTVGLEMHDRALWEQFRGAPGSLGAETLHGLAGILGLGGIDAEQTNPRGARPDSYVDRVTVDDLHHGWLCREGFGRGIQECEVAPSQSEQSGEDCEKGGDGNGDASAQLRASLSSCDSHGGLRWFGPR